jgi:hypothetical protein
MEWNDNTRTKEDKPTRDDMTAKELLAPSVIFFQSALLVTVYNLERFVTEKRELTAASANMFPPTHRLTLTLREIEVGL